MIVVAGEALIDLTPATFGSTAGYVPHPGGSPYNVAIGLGRLGVPTGFLGQLSHDPFGRMLHDHLVANQVSVELTTRGDGSTALAFVHLGEEEPEYSFHIEGTAHRALTPVQLPELPDGACLHLGSISLVMEPAASTYEYLGRRETGRRLLTLDPNVRPGLIADADVYRRRLVDWVARVDVVKTSRADLAWLMPGASVEEVALEWLERGAALVLVTLGGDGAAAYSRHARASVGPTATDVVDTVGAGDAFTAAVLADLHRLDRLERTAVEALSSNDLDDLLRFATTAASRSCTRPGADPLWADELEDLPGRDGTAPA